MRSACTVTAHPCGEGSGVDTLVEPAHEGGFQTWPGLRHNAHQMPTHYPRFLDARTPRLAE
jgi:hypothetical protein